MKIKLWCRRIGGICRIKCQNIRKTQFRNRCERDKLYKETWIQKQKDSNTKYWTDFLAAVEAAKEEVYHVDWSQYDLDDMFYCYQAYGTDPDEYIFFDYKRLNHEERIKFITDGERADICFLTCGVEGMLLFNKYKSYQLLKDLYRRNVIKVSCETDRPAFQKFIEDTPVFIKKPVVSSRGRGIAIIDAREEGLDIEALFQSLIEHKGSVLEELIVQSKQMASLHKESVNTVRCATVANRSGIHIFAVTLRIGRGKSKTDNASGGGVFANVNTETGVVFTEGLAKAYDFYENHPDTGTAIKGFQLPDWEGLTKVVTEAAKRLPKVKYVGWDLAHTDQGWVIVEGNSWGRFGILQTPANIGLKERLNGLLKGT